MLKEGMSVEVFASANTGMISHRAMLCARRAELGPYEYEFMAEPDQFFAFASCIDAQSFFAMKTRTTATAARIADPM